MSEYSDLATRAQVLLERVKAGLVQDFNKASRDFEKELRAVMTALEAKDMTEVSRARLSRLIVEMREVHTEVMGGAMLKIAEKLPAIAGAAISSELAILRGFVPKHRFNVPTAELAYKKALQQPIQATGDLLKPFVEKWSAVDMSRIEGDLRTQWAQGKTTYDTVRGIIGTQTNSYTDGALFKSRRDASSIIQTATQHTANASRQVFFEDNSDVVKGYIWLSTLDRRTTTQCKSLDGQKFLAGKGPMPPLHINCRSTTIAWLGEEFDFLLEGGTRASQTGYVPSNENYYDWLKRQPYNFQVLAMGQTRAKLFRDGGLSIDDFRALNIDRNFEPLTLAEMKKLRPEAFKRAGL